MAIPTNIADAAASIRDGDFLGLIETIKIGDLVVSALTGVNTSDNMSVTRKPVEAGYDVSDAAVRQPIELALEIVLANPDYSPEALVSAALSGDAGSLAETWRDKRDKLTAIYALKEIVTIQTHESTYDNMLIQSITPHFDSAENYDAYFATVVAIEIQNYQSDVDIDFTEDDVSQSIGQGLDNAGDGF